jgi:hypothetical protein
MSDDGASEDEETAGPSESYFQSMFFMEMSFHRPELTTVKVYYRTCQLDYSRGLLELTFEDDSAKDKLGDVLSGLFYTMGQHIVISDPHVWRPFHTVLKPTNLPSYGLHYMLVLQELLERLSSLLYGLDWNADLIDEYPQLIVHSFQWEKNDYKDIKILNEMLKELIKELEVNSRIGGPPHQTPPSKTTFLYVDHPTKESHLVNLSFRILVLRHIVCSLIGSCKASPLRANNPDKIALLFRDPENLFTPVSDYLDVLSQKFHSKKGTC